MTGRGQFRQGSQPLLSRVGSAGIWLAAGGEGCLAGAMTDLQTPRLSLHAIDTAEGERIVARRAAAEDAWAEDYPFDGDVIGVTAFLRATAAHGDHRPFGSYRI